MICNFEIAALLDLTCLMIMIYRFETAILLDLTSIIGQCETAILLDLMRLNLLNS